MQHTRMRHQQFYLAALLILHQIDNGAEVAAFLVVNAHADELFAHAAAYGWVQLPGLLRLLSGNSRPADEQAQCEQTCAQKRSNSIRANFRVVFTAHNGFSLRETLCMSH